MNIKNKITELYNETVINRIIKLKRLSKGQLVSIMKIKKINAKGKGRKKLIEEINRSICISKAINILNK